MSQLLTILFATSTGNAEECATRIATKAATLGFAPQLFNVRDYRVELLPAAGTVLLVASTWGEGEPPDDAISFWDDLQKMADNSLEGVRYGVFALGDTSYEQFCGFGRSCDGYFEKLGATRLVECKQCDLDYDDHLQEWIKDVFALLKPVTEMSTA